MKSFFFLSIAIALLPIVFGSGPCEKIESFDWTYFETGALNTCYMTETTVIDSTGFLITSSKDEAVGALTLWGNKKVRFLPEMIGETFPNLNVLVSRVCSIKAISRKNFEKLSKLVKLDLDYNQIERIDSDTFVDLKALEHLAISVNQIKYVNSRAFAALPNLKKFWIQINPCISEGTTTPSLIAKILQNVDKNCGFCELSKPDDIAFHKMTKQISDLHAVSVLITDELKAHLLEKTKEIADLSNKVTTLKIENVIGKAEVERLERDSKDEKRRAEEQIKELSEKAENLSKELHAKTSEIDAKNEELKECQRKNEILNGQGAW